MSHGQGAVDPRAIVDPSATIADNVTLGAWSVIGEGVQIGANSVIAPHVVVQAGSRIGANCRIGPFSVLGADPLAPMFLAQVTTREPLVLGDDVLVHAQSRVIGDVADGVAVAGSPAAPVELPG